mgnify:CR=1 FL=1
MERIQNKADESVFIRIASNYTGKGIKDEALRVSLPTVNQTAKIGLTPYKLDVGNYPATEEGLQALIKAPSGKESRWSGPYLEELPVDPWQNAYQYRFPGSKNVNGARGYDLWSLGPDGVESADDIGNWK